ncbi:hypothetical protein TSUD_261860 [Trifolium subterraneum]|nr:hypothetical protein TSUD_261860 [Trifolium subterraneum]
MPERNLFSWNVLVGGYAKGGFFYEASNLYDRMLWAGVRPDVYTFPCVLRTCGGVPDLVKGKEIHVHLLRFGFESDINVVNSLITMMIEYPVEPNLMTMMRMITACELIGDERLGREIHDYVMRTEFSSENLVYNSLIQMYSSVGRVKEAEIFSLKQNAEMSFLMKLHLYPYYVLAADPEENKGTIRREISVRDADRFHHFKGGICSCIAWRKVISYEALLTLAVSRVEH